MSGKLFVLEKVPELSSEDVKLINLTQSGLFPYYFQEATDNFNQLAHVLMDRNKDNLPIRGNINSDFYASFECFFLRMCAQNNIEVKTILRACVNCTTYSTEKHGDVHIDHTGFDHYNFLFYINKVNGGDTYVFNSNGNIVKEIKHSKHKMVVFNGHPHAQGFCSPGEHRFILVFTFLGG